MEKNTIYQINKNEQQAYSSVSRAFITEDSKKNIPYIPLIKLRTMNDLKTALNYALNSIQHLNFVLREMVFEEVRMKHFPDHPSRQTCLYVTNKEELAYWYRRLVRKEKRIIVFELTGRIHQASEWHTFVGDLKSVEQYRQLANWYWNGTPAKTVWGEYWSNKGQLDRQEWIFEGTAYVVDFKNNLDEID
ncbi:DUF2441 domain-containing protein [Paenibacillus riograndensis]|uniref:DUF2441 domain-containing protein n=2 Tax=Paenibacillus riograndensis TaxID=483937 RepID=A0A0E4CVW1_9BACL|nr:DUF2441 domain-containing protein [Paenibacillus riograndensis]CQR54624.1 hypothetical protein PRIO_2215 [Paenibacillus riograndensis SBR5]